MYKTKLLMRTTGGIIILIGYLYLIKNYDWLAYFAWGISVVLSMFILWLVLQNDNSEDILDIAMYNFIVVILGIHLFEVSNFMFMYWLILISLIIGFFITGGC